jgi:Tfp pilus assembly protein PilF
LSYIAQANLAETYDLAGNPAKAEKHYETAIRINPGCFEARVGLASIYAESKRHSLARKEWEAALRIQPDAAEVRKNLQRLEGKGF